jgi:hypothetical protein
MSDYLNPFEYEAASKLSLDQILDFYIEDFNYSRFVRSKRNLFLVGERGTGKTMAFLYNSLPVQLKRAESDGSPPPLDLICFYVPCNTPLTHKTDYALLEESRGAMISEHFLVLSIMRAIVDTLSKVKDLVDPTTEATIKAELEYILSIVIPSKQSLFDGIRLVCDKEMYDSQTTMNSKKLDAFYDRARSFSTGVMPLLSCLTKVPKLKNSHFVIMLDDAHDLNDGQIKALNSWIAYRDNAFFSFKVATTKVGRPTFLTASGGAILEGHDFTLIDMELPYQNKYSNFGKLAREIVLRRLQKVSIPAASPEDFFPISPDLEADLKACEGKVRVEATQRFPEGSPKQIGDYVYKYSRAAYFRDRSTKANRPPYSGFDILVHISTGVIRNLLEPCYWMFDKVISEKRLAGEAAPVIREISPSVQAEIILQSSKRKWDWIKEGFDKSIEGCSRVDAERVYRLFDNIAILFRDRLMHHSSEPRAIAFTVSETNSSQYTELIRLLDISRKAQILYTYSSSAKDSGRRETYYVPNRILWPDRGLDPHGQHARVSLKASELWAAAVDNQKLKSPARADGEEDLGLEGDLFDE